MLQEFQNWYSNLNKNKFQQSYAPHKPLTILYALSKVLKGERWIDYTEDRSKLEELIAEYTNYKTTPNCLQPIWRLQNDSKVIKVWEVTPKDLQVNKSGDISQREARERSLKAGFSESFYSWAKSNLDQVQLLISHIIDDNFPDTLVESILTQLGLADLPPQLIMEEATTSLITKIKRDPSFPKKILQLYDYRCCFCGLKIYLNQRALPMEAAHIKWKARGGDCCETNGLSLCPTHHFTFDRGLWSLNENFQIEISSNAIIDEKSDSFFKPFIGKSIDREILDKKKLPNLENIYWHQQNILK